MQILCDGRSRGFEFNKLLSMKETLKLSAPLATGHILVSCCPGGQASNVATYISKGNVALSVLMTNCSHEFFQKFTEKIITLTQFIGVILTTLL
ncbi:hypothetical protein QJS10_CPA07g00551 [Acorus calamus]|uniref:Uncharacterized protein n=1 Tax=Acorus calamus TaxID=4465 RepID=A0AAV9EEL2_ACOCL|nr:hypothetical protein QJS10_CPA07g00551 [Acorus calamus]